MNAMLTEKKNKRLNEGLLLAQGRWRNFINPMVEGYKRGHKGASPNNALISNTAMVLENTRKMMSRMDEVTKVANLGNFMDYGFGVISAVMPALLANDLVSVQPIKGRTGTVFNLMYTYGTDKGNIKRGDEMFSSWTGPERYDPITGAKVATGLPATHYTSEEVPAESLDEIPTSGSSYSTSLSFTAVAPGSVSISFGPDTLEDNGSGKIIATGTPTYVGTGEIGEIDYKSGAINITLSSNPTSPVPVAANYKFQYGNMGVGANIPQVDLDLRETVLTCVTRTLAARWMFDAAYELQQVHGINAEEEISFAMASEIRHEIDGEILNDMLNGAVNAATPTQWDHTAPTGVAYVDHKDTFIDSLIEMSNAIFSDTLRAEGNFIVAGVDVCSLIESLGGRFIPNGTSVKAGPHMIGTLDGRWKVAKNPFYPPKKWVVGYKGESYLEGGYVYAPFLPLFTTPTVMLDDFVSRRGVRTIYAKKMLNNRFYRQGEII